MASKSILLVADPFLPIPPLTYGGVERIVDILATVLAEKGWDVTLACHPDSTCGVRRLRLPSLGGDSRGRMRNALMLLSQVLRNRYDIVHTSAHFDLAAPMWPLAQNVIQTFHAPPDWGAFSKRIRVIPKRNLWFTTVGKHMAPAFNHIAPTRAIHNAIRFEEFTYQAEVRQDAPLAFLGRIERIKGTHTAIRVAQETGRKLVIAGNRSEDPRTDRYFKENIEPHLSERITYLGPVDSVAKNRLLGEAAALLMPIEWDEPFGLVMAEALACGTPVIGIERGAVPEIVDHGITGACCRSFDEMVAAVGNLDKLSRQACRLAAETKFSPDVIVDQYIDLYEDIITRRSFSRG